MQNYIWSKDPPRGHSLFFDNLKNYASLDLRYEKESKFLSSKRSKSNQFVKKNSRIIFDRKISLLYKHSLFFSKIKKNYSDLDLRYRKMSKYLFNFTFQTTHRVKANGFIYIKKKERKKLYSTRSRSISTLHTGTLRKTTPILLYDTRGYAEYTFPISLFSFHNRG